MMASAIEKPPEAKQEIWSTLLDSVAAQSQRTLPSKKLLLLGGSVEGTQEFAESLRDACAASKKKKDRKDEIPMKCSEISTYSYIDIEDLDANDTIGRIGLYMQPGCEDWAIPMLEDYIANQDPNQLMMYILLDWHAPWSWLRTIRFWIRAVTDIMEKLKVADTDQGLKIGACVKDLENKIRSYSETNLTEEITALQHDPSLARPLDAGEFDRPIGLPLVCIGQNADYIYVLAHEHGMQEEQFDFIQQVLRTALLHHGGALLYTSLAQPESFDLAKRCIYRELFQQDYSPISKEKIDPASTVVREQVFVPTGYDSWVKINILREGFKVEDLSNLWIADLDLDLTSTGSEDKPSSTAVDLYEEVIVDPAAKYQMPRRDSSELEVIAVDRMEVLQRIEQRQWEVQESSADAEEIEEIEESGLEQYDRPRSRPLQSTASRVGIKPSQVSSASQSSADKDEYVQAFFKNLLCRRESERAQE